MAQPIPGPLLYEVGRSSSGSREIFGGLPPALELVANYHVIFDDFNQVAVDGTNDWTKVVDTGCTALIKADTQHGEIELLADGNGDNEGASIQRNETVKFESGKRLLFEARCKVSDADDIDAAIGLAENFATNPEDVLLGAGCWFQINEANASILAKAGTAGASSEDTGVDAADATYVRLGFVYDGSDTVTFYVNRVAKVTMNFASMPTALLTPFAYFISGEAAADSFIVDYILVVAER